MDWADFCIGVENNIRSSVINSFPIDWDEDFITRTILKNLRGAFGNIAIDGPDTVLTIRWIPYKLSGKPEIQYGDVAIIVKIKYQDGDILEGVSFLEAKKRYINKTKFDAIDFRQLKKVRRVAPHSMVLLYDYQDITQFASPQLYYGGWADPWIRLTPSTRSVVVPTDLILNVKRKDTGIYKLSLPFSHQLCLRYLRGFDLEFTKEAIETANGFAKERSIVPLYLLTISIAYGKVEPDQIHVNGDAYGIFVGD